MLLLLLLPVLFSFVVAKFIGHFFLVLAPLVVVDLAPPPCFSVCVARGNKMDVEQYLAGVAHRMDLGPSFVNERIMNAMHDIPHDKLFKLFDDFESNLAQNRQGIRNPAAYLVGMANRVRKQTGHPSTGMVMAELEAMFRSGHIYRQDMDERCIDMLKQLPEDKGMQALAELRSVDISTVKNMSAFFMSLMKKYTHSSRGGGGKGGGGSFGTSGGGGWEGEYGRYPEPPSRGMGRDDYYPPAERHDHHHGPPRVQPHDYRSQHEMHAPERSRDMSEGDGDNWPAPKVIPPELLYGFGADEYVPEIPRVSSVSSTLKLDCYTFQYLSALGRMQLAPTGSGRA